jgi:hypothetical protein
VHGVVLGGVRLKSRSERTAVDPKLEQQTQRVLGLVARAHNVFGGDTAPAGPPEFAAPRDLEDNLGKGYFGRPIAPRSASQPPRGGIRPVGDNDSGEGGDDFADDVVDRLILGGAWTWAGGGSGTHR